MCQCLLFAPAGCCIAYSCTAAASHPLDVLPPLCTPSTSNLPLVCANWFFAWPLVVPPPLDAPLPLNALVPWMSVGTDNSQQALGERRAHTTGDSVAGIKQLVAGAVWRASNNGQLVGTEAQGMPVPSTSREPGKMYFVPPDKKISWWGTLFPHCPLADVASRASRLPSILAHGRVENFGS
jgi:hypothetical protein